ncbi:hypothetical protein AAE478_004207 [Parahypoxylon ruwenzoriense]
MATPTEVENPALSQQDQFCVICQVGIDASEAAATRTLYCGHTYHIDCLFGWCLKGGQSCPLCRRFLIRGRCPHSDWENRRASGDTEPAKSCDICNELWWRFRTVSESYEREYCSDCDGRYAPMGCFWRAFWKFQIFVELEYFVHLYDDNHHPDDDRVVGDGLMTFILATHRRYISEDESLTLYLTANILKHIPITEVSEEILDYQWTRIVDFAALKFSRLTRSVAQPIAFYWPQNQVLLFFQYILDDIEMSPENQQFNSDRDGSSGGNDTDNNTGTDAHGEIASSRDSDNKIDKPFQEHVKELMDFTIPRLQASRSIDSLVGENSDFARLLLEAHQETPDGEIVDWAGENNSNSALCLFKFMEPHLRDQVSRMLIYWEFMREYWEQHPITITDEALALGWWGLLKSDYFTSTMDASLAIKRFNNGFPMFGDIVYNAEKQEHVRFARDLIYHLDKRERQRLWQLREELGIPRSA